MHINIKKSAILLYDRNLISINIFLKINIKNFTQKCKICFTKIYCKCKVIYNNATYYELTGDASYKQCTILLNWKYKILLA